MTVHQLHAFLKRTRRRQGVRIEEQDMSTAGVPGSQVVASRKPQIHRTGDHPDRRMLLADGRHGVVSGRVVQDDHFRAQTLAGMLNFRLQVIKQAADERRRVVRDNEDGQIHVDFPLGI
jgi:hypothetical protein